MKEIPLTQGKVALIDDEDFVLIKSHKWHAHFDGRNWYSITNIKDNRKRTTLRMHRLILDAKYGEEIDHRDGNGLNNTRANLRFCTNNQNQANRRKRKDHKYSNHKGVTYNGRQWRSKIRHNYEVINLGHFDTEEGAARAYNKALKKYHGDFAKLNDVNNPLGLTKRHCHSTGKSKYRGVDWHIKSRKWRARIMIKGKRFLIGNFDNEVEAAEAYDCKAIIFLGENAITNFLSPLEVMEKQDRLFDIIKEVPHA